MVLVQGAVDRVPVAGRAQQLAAGRPGVDVVTHPDGEHNLPIAEPAWCARLLTVEAMESGPPSPSPGESALRRSATRPTSHSATGISHPGARSRSPLVHRLG